MHEANVRNRFLSVFLAEWELYRAKGEAPAARRSAAQASGSFDELVQVGEIRVFADSPRPTIGLVLKDQGADGWLVVPVSDFTVPATEQEILVGERVYQLWNAFTAPRNFVARSWTAETVVAEDLTSVTTAERCVLTGDPLPDDLLACTGLPIEKTDDPRLAYEKAFQEQQAVKSAAQAKPRRFWRRNGVVWGLAASLVVVAGVTVVTLREAETFMSAGLSAASSGRRGNYSHYESACDERGNLNCRVLAQEERPCLAADCSRAVARQARAAADCAMVMERRSRVFCKSSEPEQAELLPEAEGSERYSTRDENEFVEVVREPLSTFGLDVDTAGYATMRRYLTDLKRLPPQDSVRIEEYVNYFEYDYPQPTGEHPIAVHCELAACPWAKDHKLLKVGLQAKKVPPEKLPPSNLVFLLDCSGSMAFNQGFDTLVKSMRLLIEQLRPQDHVSIVTYASDTRVALPATSGANKAAIRKVIDSLRASGGTYGAGGVQLAYEEAEKNFDPKANNRVILMTDGDFNIGISDPGELKRFIAGKRDSGVFLTVLGVGRGNCQDRTMKTLANAGNGNYAFIDGILEAKKVLMTELCGSLYTIAKDVKLQLEFNPSETQAYRLLGYEHRKLAAKDFNDDRKDAGEMGAGHTMTAFYELVPVGASNVVAKTDALKYQKTSPVASGELLTVKLRYKEPTGVVSKLMEQAVSSASITRKEGPSEDFRFASSVVEYALLLERSKYKGTASLSSLIERAREAKGKDLRGYRAEFVRLAETAELLFSGDLGNRQ